MVFGQGRSGNHIRISRFCIQLYFSVNLCNLVSADKNIKYVYQPLLKWKIICLTTECVYPCVTLHELKQYNPNFWLYYKWTNLTHFCVEETISCYFKISVKKCLTCCKIFHTNVKSQYYTQTKIWKLPSLQVACK